MSEENKRLILIVIGTLNRISVHGEENLDRLLASIQALKSLVEEEKENADLDGN